MWTDHPTAADLDGFLRRAYRPGSTARDYRVVRHLLAECVVCHQQLEAMGWDDRRLTRLLYLPGAGSFEGKSSISKVYNYDAAFAKAERAYQALLEEPLPAEQPAERLWAALESQPPEEQMRLVIHDRRLSHPALVQHLIESSHALRYSDPA